MSKSKLFVGQETTKDLILQSAGNPLHSLWLVSGDFVAQAENPQANGFVDVKEIYPYPYESEKQPSEKPWKFEPGLIFGMDGKEIKVTAVNDEEILSIEPKAEVTREQIESGGFQFLREDGSAVVIFPKFE